MVGRPFVHDDTVTEGSPYREIGSTRNVEIKNFKNDSKWFQAEVLAYRDITQTLNIFSES